MTMNEAIDDEIKRDMSNILIHIENILDYIENTNQQNEQFVLDFLDKLNKLSVKF